MIEEINPIKLSSYEEIIIIDNANRKRQNDTFLKEVRK